MDDLELEYEMTKQKQQPVKIVKKGGFLGKLVALLLGIVIGFVGCFGAIAAVVYYFVGVMKIEDGANYLKGLGLDFEYTDYISESYSDKTAFDVVLASIDAVNKTLEGGGSLNTFNDIFPVIHTLVAGTESTEENVINGLVPILNAYGLKLDADKMMSLTIGSSTSGTLEPDVYLSDYVLNSAYAIAIGDLLQQSGMYGNPLIDGLFFGTEGVDYVENPDGTRSPLEGGTPWLTIGDLLFAQEDVIGERINAFTLDTFLNVDLNDSLITTLAYGASHRYTIENGTVVMNQQTYSSSDGTHFHDDYNDEVQGVQKTASGVPYFTQGKRTVYLEQSTSGDWLAYTDESCTIPALYSKTTVGDLNDNPSTITNRMEVGSLLNVTPSSNKILLSLAYGTEGEDYTVVDGNIQMCEGKNARTLGDLKNNADSIIEDVPLSDVMTPDIGDPVTMYLLYGKKGTHYTIDVNDKPVCLQKQIAVVGDTAYNAYGDVALDGRVNETEKTYAVDDVTYYLQPVPVSETDSTQKTVTVRQESVDTEAKLYYVFSDESHTKAVYFHPTTLGELTNDSTVISNLTGRLSLAEVLGEDAIQGTPMESLGHYPIDEVPDKIDTLTIGDVIDTSGSSVLKHLSETQIKDLGTEVDNLTIGQILEDSIYETDSEGNRIVKTDANSVLVYLKDTSITGLTTKINDMKVSDIFKKDINKTNANPILVSLKDCKITEMGAKVDELTVGNIFEKDIYEKDSEGNYKTDSEGKRIVKGTWRYLLKDTREGEGYTKGLIHTEYKLTSDMNVMLNNMSENMKNASLEDLNNDGIIDLSNQKDKLLSRTESGKIKYVTGINQADFGNKAYFCELTVSELFDYVGKLLGTLP